MSAEHITRPVGEGNSRDKEKHARSHSNFRCMCAAEYITRRAGNGSGKSGEQCRQSRVDVVFQKTLFDMESLKGGQEDNAHGTGVASE